MIRWPSVHFIAKRFDWLSLHLREDSHAEKISGPAQLGTYLLSSVLSTFPRELLEAARMDGARRARVLWRVVVPVPLTTSGAALLGVFPIITFFLIFQRTLTPGVTVGSVW
jgi:ABC-type glycerol-3-phosphate transport system permease component